MGATRLASGIKAKVHTPNKDSHAALITRLSVNFCLKIPTRDASPPLVLAFSGSVLCLRLVLHLALAFSACVFHDFIAFHLHLCISGKHHKGEQPLKHRTRFSAHRPQPGHLHKKEKSKAGTLRCCANLALLSFMS